MGEPIITALRNERLRRRWPQRRLAGLLGVQQSVVSEWETGAVDPLSVNLERWAEALGFEVVLRRAGSS